VIRRFPGGGWALRLVIFLGPIVALLAASPQGRTPPTWLVVVVGIFSFAFAVMPEHYVGNGALAIVVAWWTVEMEDGLPLSSIAAAAALLAAHLAGTLASYGPARLAPDADTRVGLGGRATLHARYLSAGQRRKLALACLVACRRSLWLLDEVLTSLDEAAAGLVASFIDEHLSGGGMAVIATHQEVTLAGRVSQRIELAA